MTNSNLISRIANGYIWLKDNPTDPHFPEALKLYESLVDEARELGIKEKDCWPATPEEVEDIFVPKQLTD